MFYQTNLNLDLDTLFKPKIISSLFFVLNGEWQISCFNRSDSRKAAHLHKACEARTKHFHKQESPTILHGRRNEVKNEGSGILMSHVINMSTEWKVATKLSERNRYLDLDSLKFRAIYSLQSNSLTFCYVHKVPWVINSTLWKKRTELMY